MGEIVKPVGMEVIFAHTHENMCAFESVGSFMLQLVVVCIFPIVKVVYLENLMDLFSNASKEKFCVCNTKGMFCCVLT